MQFAQKLVRFGYYHAFSERSIVMKLTGSIALQSNCQNSD
jgi:hypothetical protein